MEGLRMFFKVVSIIINDNILSFQECASLFIDTRDKEVKHAFALMFVEILLPVAAGANRELNVPALKTFVDMMYHHTFDLTKKTRHSQVHCIIGWCLMTH